MIWLGVGLVVGFLAGVIVTAWRARTIMPKHVHAFDAWEDSTINYLNTERTVSAQRRRCITCNFKEVRQVIDD
jgi:hypothetical protein